LDMLSQPTRLDGVDHHGSACVGVALLSEDAESYSVLVKQADLALHHAKSMGRSRQSLFTPDMQSSLNSRAQLDADLRTALQEGQFRVCYQMQVTHEGRAFGVETLLRWEHPAKGLVPPGEFIAQAEKSGFIIPLGQWVLEQACRQLATWSRDQQTAKLTIAVNVSSLQIQQDNFVDQVSRTLTATGANGRLLKLELTESLLLDNIEDVAQKMRALRALGVCFSLDDFGTGFSSLAYLKSLPLTEIKIDQRFVRDIDTNLNDLAIARTVMALGNSLELSVTAEGVENEAQRQALLGIGCLRYQGFLFGGPVPIQAINLRLQQLENTETHANF
jgi:EAL domain-containing protein (putative c-di-GMP-specific phosphodiesterase class I)